MNEDNGNGKLYAHQLVIEVEKKFIAHVDKVVEHIDTKFKEHMDRSDDKYVSNKECREYHQSADKRISKLDTKTTLNKAKIAGIITLLGAGGGIIATKASAFLG